MKLKSRSLVLTTIIAISAGWIVPASVHSVTTGDACSSMLVPEGVSCVISPKTGQPVAVSQACQFTMSAVSIRAGTDPFKEGMSLNGGPVCKRDPQTDLPIVVVPAARTKALPPIKARQEKARSILAAPKVQDACTGMNVPTGMICLVNPTTGRPKAHWDDCANWIIPAGIACVVDPETGTAMTVVRPD
jgi:hypothetical protein